MKLRDGREFDPVEVTHHEGRFNVYDCERGHELLSLDLAVTLFLAAIAIAELVVVVASRG